MDACGWRLHRQVGRLLTLQDAINVAGGAPILVGQISSIRDQTAASDEQPIEIDCGQFVGGRKLNDQIVSNAPMS